MEDVDFGLRCALAGQGGSYVPSAVAYHRGSATLGEWNKDTVWRIARNQVLLAAKHFRVSRAGRLWPDSCSGDWSPCGMGADVAFVRGKFAGMRGPPDEAVKYK